MDKIIQQEPEEYCIYAHYIPHSLFPFYIGKGKKNRPYDTKSRTIHWKNIYKKYGVEILILETNLTNDMSIQLEIEYIRLFGRKDCNSGILINYTNGGEGCYNRIISDETRKKISLSNKGKKLTDKQKEFIRNFNTGRKASEETKLKMSLKRKGRNPSQKTKDMISNKNTGKKHSNESKKKMSLSKKELLKNPENHNFFGKHHTKESKEKISKNFKAQYKKENHPFYNVKGESNPLYGRKRPQDVIEKLRSSKMGEKNPMHRSKNPRIKKVRCVETNIVYNSIVEASDATNTSSCSIQNCCAKRRITANGYHWEYFYGEN
jgi:hypothetical protein